MFIHVLMTQKLHLNKRNTCAVPPLDGDVTQVNHSTQRTGDMFASGDSSSAFPFFSAPTSPIINAVLAISKCFQARKSVQTWCVRLNGGCVLSIGLIFFFFFKQFYRDVQSCVAGADSRDASVTRIYIFYCLPSESVRLRSPDPSKGSRKHRSTPSASGLQTKRSSARSRLFRAARALRN